MLQSVREKLLRSETKAALFAFIVVLVIMCFIGFLASDMYVPSLPVIAKYFATSELMVKLSIASCILGLALSQLLCGTLSDRFGRRRMVLIGLMLSIVGSLVCMFAPSVKVLIIGRFLQGAGFGAGMGIVRTIICDVFRGARLAQVGSYLGLSFALSPAVAPIMGGYLQHWFGWRSIFLFLTLYALFALLVVWLFLPETNKHLDPKATRLHIIKQNYISLLSNSAFLGYSLCTSAALGGLIVYYTISPFLIQNVLGYSPVQYGWLAIFIAFSILAGRVLNVYFVGRLPLQKLLAVGIGLMTLSGITMLVIGLMGVLNIAVVIVPMMLFIIGSGFVLANSMVGALQPFAHIAGAAGAMYGSLQMLGIFLVSTLAASVHTHNQTTLALILTILGGLAWLGYSFTISTADTVFATE